MKPIQKAVAVLALAGAVSGCESLPRFDDGYQVGDVIGTAQDGAAVVRDKRQRYCDRAQGPFRSLVLTVAGWFVPALPADGVCVGLGGGGDGNPD